MLIKVKKAADLKENSVTDEAVYENRPRRHFLQKAAGLTLGIPLAQSLGFIPERSLANSSKESTLKARKTDYQVKDTDRPLTPEKLALTYNNFYEFSLDKEEVSKKVEKWNLQKPWTVEVSGIKGGTKTFDVDQLVTMGGGLEERIYRFRCVEAWSMVLPWIGFSLGELIKKLEPDSTARYIYFETFSDKKIGTNIGALP
ncbi:MAG: molybdopterin-dependent oxidoreductase, partial [Pseudobdellovibrionaceae bacterium]